MKFYASAYTHLRNSEEYDTIELNQLAITDE